MARLYITYNAPQISENGLSVSVACHILGAGSLVEFGLGMEFTGEPAANTITNTIRSVCVALAENLYGAQVPPGTVVTFGGPT